VISPTNFEVVFLDLVGVICSICLGRLATSTVLTKTKDIRYNITSFGTLILLLEAKSNLNVWLGFGIRIVLWVLA
jgi:hypothetical protein